MKLKLKSLIILTRNSVYRCVFSLSLPEIEASKFCVLEEISNQLQMSMGTKQLWSHLLTCFQAYCSDLLSSTKLDTLKLWSEAKPVLSTLESMRKSLCHSQTETFKALSVLWLQIRLLVGQLSDSVKHIDQELLPFFQAFNLSMRRYVEGIFLVAFFKTILIAKLTYY